MSSTFSSASSPLTYLRARTVNHFRVQQRSGSFCNFSYSGSMRDNESSSFSVPYKKKNQFFGPKKKCSVENPNNAHSSS